MDMLRAILDCISGDDQPATPARFQNFDHAAYNVADSMEKEQQLAVDIFNTLYASEKPQEDISKLVHPSGWYEGLAKQVLNHLVDALNSGKAMGRVMKNAFERASTETDQFVHEHPVFAAVAVTVVAIGILAILLPWVVEALGFGELGPVEGSFAAWWQSTFPDAEAGSFFSYLQRLGMTWGQR